MSDAPVGKSVLLADPVEGVVAGTGTLIKGQVIWFPDPSSAESDSLRPLAWMNLPEMFKP